MQSLHRALTARYAADAAENSRGTVVAPDASHGVPGVGDFNGDRLRPWIASSLRSSQ